MKNFKFISLLLLILTTFISHGFSEPHNINKIKPFNYQNNRIKLNNIDKTYIQIKHDSIALDNKVDELEALREYTENCITQSADKLKIINNLLEETKIKNSSVIANDHKYLNDKKAYLEKQLSNCRLFIYHLDEVLFKYKEQQQTLNASEIFTKTGGLTDIDNVSLKYLFASENFEQLHDTYTQMSVSEKIFLAIIILGSIISAYFFKAYFKNNACLNNLTAILSSRAKNRLYNYISLFLALVFILCGILIIQLVFEKMYYFMTPVIYGLITSAILICLNFIFNPNYKFSKRLNLPAKTAKKVYQLFFISTLIILIYFCLNWLYQPIILTQTLLNFLDILFTLIMLSLVFSLAFLFIQIPKFKINYPQTNLILKLILVGVFVCLSVLELLGYQSLVSFIFYGLLLSCLIIISTILWIKLIHYLYRKINDPEFNSSKNIHAFFGVRPQKSMNEFILVKYTLDAIGILFSIYLLLEVWDASLILIDRYQSWILKGFTYTGLSIYPTKIIVGITIFVIIMLLGRYIASAISDQNKFSETAETQVAIASITIYCAFAVGLVLALLLMGVNFTGLAIIAGALSVGIGLGLQTIVNNFVSGLILLLEKPVKPGDRVIVGDIEGFVKKVRIRATQIKTLAHEDVIIPNADLITLPVTNYMFRDRMWRVVCQVGVAYGSDVELVKNLLLNVAQNHSEVLSESEHKPQVLFSQFGDSSLVFELWSVITDVNRKFQIASELNFAIDKIFREHKVVIAFPQRDVHIIEHKKT